MRLSLVVSGICGVTTRRDFERSCRTYLTIQSATRGRISDDNIAANLLPAEGDRCHFVACRSGGTEFRTGIEIQTDRGEDSRYPDHFGAGLGQSHRPGNSLHPRLLAEPHVVDAPGR